MHCLLLQQVYLTEADLILIKKCAFRTTKKYYSHKIFYSGHVATATTATFFSSKVYQDFIPDSHAIPYVYAEATILPAAVSYFRMQAGQHFLTDVMLGYTLGALAGYYISELHKKKNESISFQPIIEQNFYDTSFLFY
ncbi:phosphatase PAP2 family protein [Polaribacter cellanae]|uniref:Phosphatase PAP2 family protein n=1 Tax=Polaribacter cellanae TaxID=2818493 RepID=A0A975H7F1_9FLAO|nr:phosphatase PAP2 family protein [Polaribacter cellanae]QTE23402.1 phosphatase PAP2 family protein [Polaribacter cellanae]